MTNFDKIIDRSGTGSIKYDRRKQVFGREDVLPMWVADMDFESPSFVIDAIKKRLEHPVLGYTLRQDPFADAFIGWANRRYSWDVKKCWLTFSPGVVPALVLSILAMTEEGDKIIIQPPVYAPFFEAVEGNGRTLVTNPLKKDENGRYTMDFDDLEKKIDDRTKMIIISNPHNPVGRVWSEEELRTLGEIALKHGLIIVSDDIHADFIYKGHKYTPIAKLDERFADITVTAMSPSKTFNIAGLSTSIVVIPNEELRNKYNHKLMSAHLFLGNIFGGVAFEAAYNNGDQWLGELLEYLEANIDYAVGYIREKIPSIKVWRPESTFLLWLDFSGTGLTHEEVKDKLINEALLGFNDGKTFGEGGEMHFRMNIAAPRKVVEDALGRLERVFA